MLKNIDTLPARIIFAHFLQRLNPNIIKKSWKSNSNENNFLFELEKTLNFSDTWMGKRERVRPKSENCIVLWYMKIDDFRIYRWIYLLCLKCCYEFTFYFFLHYFLIINSKLSPRHYTILLNLFPFQRLKTQDHFIHFIWAYKEYLTS